MTPEEKAKELVERFLKVHISSGGIGMTEKHAKACALICVEEILLNEFGKNYHRIGQETNSDFIKARLDYWQQVKTSIENL